MVHVLPFSALRPNNNFLEKIVCPPYDVVSREEAREIAVDNPYSFMRIIRPDLEFSDEISPYDEVVYNRARANLDRLIREKILFYEKEPSLYLYRLSYKGNEQLGVIGLSSIEDYQNNKIKKHELTRPQKEQDRIKHIESLEGNTGPVFLMYDHEQSPSMERIMQEVAQIEETNPGIEYTLLYDYETSDKVRHRIYKASQIHTEQLLECFAEMPHTYIADGHHRSAAAVKSNLKAGKSHFLSVIFPNHHLTIYPYNRLVYLEKELYPNFSVNEFLSKIKEKFILQPCSECPIEKNDWDISMYLNSQWFTLKYKSELFLRLEKEIEKLPSHLLQIEIFSPLLQIENIREAKNVEFVGGEFAHLEIEKRAKKYEQGFAIAFAIPSVTVQQVQGIADNNEIMPPKSTWFYPKLYSGFVSYSWGSQQSPVA